MPTAIADRATRTRKPTTIARHMDFLSRNRGKRTLLLYGSAGSGKSQAVALDLVFNRFYREDGIRILVVRKTLPSLRTSAYDLILGILNDHNLPYGLNKSNLVISNRRNQMLFRPLDDPEKLKSIENVTHVWGEEATEFARKDYMQLDLRCRGKAREGAGNQLVYTFNPVNENSFLKPLTDKPTDDMAVMHSTYKDNPYLDPAYVAAIEAKRELDDTFWQIYGEGLWATPTNIVYTNWDVVPDSEWPERYDDERYGVDFGFSESATAGVHVRRVGFEIWERELVYKRKLTVNDLKAKLCQEISPDDYTRMMCDSARPDDIEELHRAGFNAHGCKKGPGSVKTGIQRVKQFRVHVLESAVNLQREKLAYSWKVDKDDNVLDAVVQKEDHGQDAERYAVSDMAKTQADYGNYGSANDMQAVEDAKTTADDPGVRAMINELATAGGERVTAICQAFIRNPTPAVLAALKANQDSDNAQVSMRCREILRVLKATGRVQ